MFDLSMQHSNVALGYVYMLYTVHIKVTFTSVSVLAVHIIFPQYIINTAQARCPLN